MGLGVFKGLGVWGSFKGSFKGVLEVSLEGKSTGPKYTGYLVGIWAPKVLKRGLEGIYGRVL